MAITIVNAGISITPFTLQATLEETLEAEFVDLNPGFGLRTSDGSFADLDSAPVDGETYTVAKLPVEEAGAAAEGTVSVVVALLGFTDRKFEMEAGSTVGQAVETAGLSSKLTPQHALYLNHRSAHRDDVLVADDTGLASVLISEHRKGGKKN